MGEREFRNERSTEIYRTWEQDRLLHRMVVIMPSLRQMSGAPKLSVIPEGCEAQRSKPIRDPLVRTSWGTAQLFLRSLMGVACFRYPAALLNGSRIALPPLRSGGLPG